MLGTSYMLVHLGVPVAVTGSNGSDKRACRSSKVCGLSLKEILVDVWGFWVVVGIVGFSWDDVGVGED